MKTDAFRLLRLTVAALAFGATSFAGDPLPLELVGVPPDATVDCGEIPAPAQVSTTGGCPLAGLANGLELYYSFDADEGGMVTDHSTNGYDGVVYGAQHSPTGRFGGSLLFDGNDYVDAGSVLDIGTGNPVLTASVWFKTPVSTSAATFVGKNQAGWPYTGWNLRADPHPIADLIADYPDRADPFLNEILFDGTWHHMAGVFEVTPTSLTSRLYVDGAFIGSDTDPGAHAGTETAANLLLGTRGPGVVENLVGELDEVRVYSRKLSDAEIMALYTGEETGSHVVEMTQTVTGDCPVVVTRVWSASDGCGQSVSATQVITVADFTPPVLHDVPADTSVNCGEVPPPAGVTASDCTSGSEAVTNGLLVAYLFDTDEEIVITDDSGNGYDGVSIGSTYTPGGRFGGARAFDGSSQITIPLNQNGIRELTYALWIKPGTQAGSYYGAVVSCDLGDYGRGFVLLKGDNQYVPFYDDFYETLPSVTFTKDTGTWYHVVAVFSPTNNAVYVDGELVHTDTTYGNEPPYNDTTNLFLGVRGLYGDRRYTGLMDEVLIYDRALDAEEVAALYGAADGEVDVTLDETVDGYCPATVTRVWTAVDACGNSASATQVITVVDNVTLELNGVPEDVVVECGSVPGPAAVTAVGECFSLGINDGLELYYTFDADEGGTVTDHSTNGYDGVVYGAQHSPTGRFGGALSFDGNDYVDAGNVLDIGVSNPVLTASVWFKVPVSTNPVTFVGKNQAGWPYTGWNLRAAPYPMSDLIADYPDRADPFYEEILFDGTWHHMAGVFEVTPTSLTSRLYVDGAFVGSDTDPGAHAGTETTANLLLGTRGPGVVENLVGEIDEVRVYSRKLSDAEIMALYTRQYAQNSEMQYTEVVTGDCPTTITRSWTATDSCGNTASATQLITIADYTPPSLLGVPGDVTVNCGHVPPPAAVTASDCASPGMVTNGLLAEFTFDADEGISVTDDSGNGYHGVSFGAAYTPYGRFGGARAFDGSSQITIPLDQNGIRELSYALWIKPGTQAGAYYGAVVSCDLGDYGRGFVLLKGANEYVAFYDDDYETLPSVTFAKDTGTWYHVVAVFSPTNNAVYVDGELVHADTMFGNEPSYNDTTNLYLGVRGLYGDRRYTGLMDEVKVYGRALSAEDVAALYGTDTAELAVEFEESVIGDCPGTVTRTWSATDGCGNTAVATQTITVLELGNLDLVGVPDDITVECGFVPVPPAVTATSDCPVGIAPTNGLVLAYSFDADEGAVVTDDSGNGYHGTANGTSFDPNGRQGGARHFDGSSDVVIPFDQNGVRDLTYSIWMKPGVQPGPYWGAVISCDLGDYGRGFALRTNLVSVFYDDDYENITWFLMSTAEVLWYHVALVFSPTNNQVYINGALVLDDTTYGNEPPYNDTTNLYLGVRGLYGDRRYQGSLDEFKVFDRALTSNEVAALYNLAGEDPWVVFSENTVGDCPGVITRTWSASDGCGNSAAATQVINVVKTGSLDSDNDKIPDSWEIDNGLNPFVSNEGMDSDNDTYSDYEEYLTDTDPLDDTKFFEFTVINPGSPVILAFQSSADRVYTLQFSANIGRGIWIDVPGQVRIPGTGGIDTLQHVAAETPRTYRIVADVP